MKVLIWILSFIPLAIINTICQSFGLFLGGIPTALLFAGSWWVGRKLTRNWERHNLRKKAALKGLTEFEYIKSIVPQSVVDFCEKHKTDKQGLKAFLKACVRDQYITQLDADILLVFYR